MLTLQISHFDALAHHPSFPAVQAYKDEKFISAVAQLEADSPAEVDSPAEKLERAFETAFMLGLGQGLSMHHGNWHDVSCAIAYRHSLVNIVKFIEAGQISSARRALKAARSCELCRKPMEPAWDLAAMRAKMDQLAQNASQGGTGAASSSLDGGSSASSHDAGSSSDALSAAPVVTPPPPLHPLLQVVCTVLECVAKHLTTHSLVMLRRSCRDANASRAEVPLHMETPGADPERLGLAFRLAKALEVEHGLGWPSERVFEFSSSLRMYDDAIDEHQTKLVGRRRALLRQRFREHPERGDAAHSVAVHGLHDGLVALRRVMEMDGDGAGGSELKAETERRLLMSAIANDDRPALRYLMYEIGISPGVPHDFTGSTPLHVAARVGSVPMMAAICSDGTIGASLPMPPEGQALLDESGMSVLGVAIQQGHVDAVKWLIEECEWDLDDEVELRIVRMAFRRCPGDSHIRCACHIRALRRPLVQIWCCREEPAQCRYARDGQALTPFAII